MWLLLGVYNTAERLFKMKKTKTASCVLCLKNDDILDEPTEDRVHFMLSCPALADIREDFLCQLVNLSPVVTKYMTVSPEFLLCILDPFSPRVPGDLRESWLAEEDVYRVCRNFCFSMHKKRTKLLELIAKNAIL